MRPGILSSWHRSHWPLPRLCKKNWKKPKQTVKYCKKQTVKKCWMLAVISWRLLDDLDPSGWLLSPWLLSFPCHKKNSRTPPTPPEQTAEQNKHKNVLHSSLVQVFAMAEAPVHESNNTHVLRDCHAAGCAVPESAPSSTSEMTFPRRMRGGQRTPCTAQCVELLCARLHAVKIPHPSTAPPLAHNRCFLSLADSLLMLGM